MEPQMTAADLAEMVETQREWDDYGGLAGGVVVPGECPTCDGYGLDPACTGHATGPGVLLYCGCPRCGGDDLTVRLSHSDRAALAA